MICKFDIEQFIDIDYATDIRKDRRKNNKEGKSTAEFFTPYSIVLRMCDKVEPEIWADPTKTFLESSFGNGQFILMILYRRIYEYNIPWKTALETVFGVELMQDNVAETKQRVHELLRNISPDYDPDEANRIMDKNLVCSDFFTWDFKNWRPYTDEELKKLKIKKRK